MILPALLLFAQATTPPPASDEIVVIGHRAEEALAACLSRNCPPAEEVEASLQASVEQFADGRYQAARRTLEKAIQRNQRYAASMPGPVSSLHATLATIAEHYGDKKLWRNASRNNMVILREHLGGTAPATLFEWLSYGDDNIGLQNPVIADRAYADVEKRSIASGQDDVAAHARFRRAWLALMRNRTAKAERFMDEAVAIAKAERQAMLDYREIIRMRIALRHGDAAAVDALSVRLRQSADRRPRLLYSRPTVLPERILGGAPVEGGIRYADIGYWIRPDGRTAEAEVLRTSGLAGMKGDILKQVRDRRYVPLEVEPGHPGLYRIDRFTVRASLDRLIGSRIKGRAGPSTVHIVDLTETEALADTHRRLVAEAAPVSTH